MAKFFGDYDHCLTAGERLITRMLVEKLPDNAVVWSNVQLSGANQAGESYEREIDCLAYIHDLGLFILEAKDWRIDQLERLDSHSVQLTSGKIFGNPFRGMNSRYYCVKSSLQGRIKDETGRIPFPINMICCFPFINRDEWETYFKNQESLPADVGFYKSKVLCADDMGGSAKEILKFFSESRSSTGRFPASLSSRHEEQMTKLFGSGIDNYSAVFKLIATSEFRTSIQNLRGRGGLCQKAADEMLVLVQQKTASYKLHDKVFREINGIENCIAYRFNGFCELVTLHHGGIIYPIFAGTAQDVDLWANENQGLVIAINNDTKRISLTLNTPLDQIISVGEVSVITSENQPLFERIEGFSLDLLNLGKIEKRYFSSLNETSDPLEIDEMLAELADQGIARLLADMTTLIRKGDREAAKAAWELYTGTSTTAESDPVLECVALDEDVNSDIVCTLTGMDSSRLEALFDPDSFDDWMLFLHPEQKKVVDCDSEKPMLITGVSGSGKTCILAHRARRLAQADPTSSVGILTLNRTLAKFINELVGKLCSKEEAAQIRCFAYYDYFKKVIERLGAKEYVELYKETVPVESPLYSTLCNVHPNNLVREYDHQSREEINDTWEETLEQQDRNITSAIARIKIHLEKEYFLIDVNQYLKDELELVRTALPLVGRKDSYYSFARNGRAIPFRQGHRDDVLYILSRFEEYMFYGGMLDTAGLTQILLCKDIRDRLKSLPQDIGFDHILVDEFQDFSSVELTILRAIPRAQKNAFCATGDTTQKIYPKELKMMNTGLVAGSAKVFRIRKNFRNSKQILQAASKLSKYYAEIARRQGIDIDFIDPDLAERETAKPRVIYSEKQIAYAWKLAAEWLTNEKLKPWTVCIATADPHKLDVSDILDEVPDGLLAERISSDLKDKQSAVRVAELGDVKGFEFSLIIIIGCSAEAFPNRRLPPDEAWRDALRLYVAMTRGRDQVVLTYSGQPSSCLELMRSELTWEGPHASMEMNVEIAGDKADELFEKFCENIHEQRLPYAVLNSETNDVIIPANGKITKSRIHKLVENCNHLTLPADSVITKIINDVLGEVIVPAKHILKTGK